MRRRIVAILSVLLLGVVAAWWFDLPSYLGLRAARDGPLTLYGNVDIRQVQLGFRVSGRVAEMSFDEGDSIKPGDLLARLDAKPYEDAIAAATAQVATQRAALDKLVAGPRAAEISQARSLLDERIADRALARREKRFDDADRIRSELAEEGFILEDKPDGTTNWRRA